MKNKLFVTTALLMVLYQPLQAQDYDTTDKEYFVGSTFFMLANLVDDPEPPNYAQLNFGFRKTPKDIFSVELITWNYYEPLGVPASQKSSAPNFPGKVEAYGAGLSYKRFFWKRGFVQVHATLLKQNYLDESDNKIQDGYQLFNTVRLGYQFRFFKNRFFFGQ